MTENVAKTIAVTNRKGGVGKTTTALCLTDCLRDRGYRVLLVDLDQQHNSTDQYHAAIEGEYTAFDMLTDRATPMSECIQHTDRGDIIAGDDCMSVIEERMLQLDNREYMLFDGLAQVAGGYDYIVIDCPPSLGTVCKNVLVAADEVIVPMLPDGYSHEAFEALMAQVAAVRASPRLNPDLRIAGMLLTQYDGRRVLARRDAEELPEIAEKYGTRLFETRIRPCEETRKAQRAAVSLFELAPACTAAQDYRDFTREYLIG